MSKNSGSACKYDQDAKIMFQILIAHFTEVLQRVKTVTKMKTIGFYILLLGIYVREIYAKACLFK